MSHMVSVNKLLLLLLLLVWELASNLLSRHVLLTCGDCGDHPSEDDVNLIKSVPVRYQFCSSFLVKQSRRESHQLVSPTLQPFAGAQGSCECQR